MKYYNKKWSVILVLLFTVNILTAQSLTDHDPSVNNPNIIFDNTTNQGKVSFDFEQLIADYDYTPDSDPLRITVCILNLDLAYSNVYSNINSTGLDKFNWQYDALTNCLLATQKADLKVGEVLNIALDIKTDQPALCENDERMGFNINIQPAPSMTGINDIENDNVSTYTCLETTTNISSVENQLFAKVYPNPVSDFLVIEMDDFYTELQIQLVDVDGKELFREEYENFKFERIDLRDLSSGIYTVILKSGDKFTRRKITVLQR